MRRESTAEMRARLTARLADIPWKRVTGEVSLINEMARRLDRPVTLVTAREIPGGYVGQSELLNGEYRITVLQDLAERQRILTLLHEFAHCDLGHLVPEKRIIRHHMPKPRTRLLNQEAVDRMLRSAYDDPLEREAEVYGTLLANQLEATVSQRRQHPPGAGALMATVLAHTPTAPRKRRRRGL